MFIRFVFILFHWFCFLYFAQGLGAQTAVEETEQQESKVTLVTLQLQSRGREKGRGDVKARAQLFFSILLSPGPQSIG